MLDTPDEQNTRRSKRTIVPPLQYWKNERIDYERRKSGKIHQMLLFVILQNHVYNVNLLKKSVLKKCQKSVQMLNVYSGRRGCCPFRKRSMPFS